MKLYSFRVIIEPEKPKGYHGFVPILKGVHTYGDNIQEIKKNLKEAIICHIQGLLKDKDAGSTISGFSFFSPLGRIFLH